MGRTDVLAKLTRINFLFFINYFAIYRLWTALILNVQMDSVSSTFLTNVVLFVCQVCEPSVSVIDVVRLFF